MEGAAFARDEGAVALKVASSNITHLPLIRQMASLGLPLLIDTGRASLAEVDLAVRAARRAGCAEIVLEHSPDGHPAPPENHNLHSLRTLAMSFDVPVGLSDHHNGTEMLFVALGLGVDLLEKNIVVGAGMLEQDHAFAVPGRDLAGLVGSLSNAWIALGRPFRDVSRTHGLISTSARMGLVTRRKARSGDAVSLDTVRFAFPCRGIGAQHFDLVEGWRFAVDLDEGAVVTWHDVRA
jgi:sialic acid synthase SpsE